MSVLDLRSDTVTRPSQAMRTAMAEAEVGDDVYGDDPTVNALEREVAELLGYEAGLFTPSGSMANQLGLRLLVKPGEELVCDRAAHVVRAELGAAAVFSGITTRTWDAPAGLLDPADVEAIITPNAGPHLVSTTAIAIENTHNFGGGTVQPLEAVRAVQQLAREHGIGLHLDGARLWNASVASGVALNELAAGFDTVSVCLSKGLGAPVGSVLVSSAERIAAARMWRKRYGGGMRQVGILAAAGSFALQNNLKRLAEDHDRAQRLAAALGLDPSRTPTNIVVVTVDNARAIAVAAAEQGLLVSALGPTFLRMVTHLDVDDDGIDRAIEILRPLVRG
ncbi:threonine aldolase family protein [Jatrophihabitans lederbergiae]|uniref:GntG family PLP-dependent aldolase n=1 Tax=Jatrophihabitans lederbergiae TaxID=3075547 RepID=A0ABU2J8N2_9ACTN|nr:GntG family PLP-dependent aldolase [Jatrophihabitans sp. DSM 44399]MDT0261344.1 GntG family PLP-dependent aldolase [Jatrophihabitans sp. DSM 44399]